MEGEQCAGPQARVAANRGNWSWDCRLTGCRSCQCWPGAALRMGGRRGPCLGLPAGVSGLEDAAWDGLVAGPVSLWGPRSKGKGRMMTRILTCLRCQEPAGAKLCRNQALP